MTDQLAIRIPSSQKSLLETLANQKNTTVSALVRVAIGLLLEQTYPENNSQILLELADIGKQTNTEKGNDVPKDLSTNYKSYLYSKPNKNK